MFEWQPVWLSIKVALASLGFVVILGVSAAYAMRRSEFAGKAASSGLIDKKDADIDGYVTQKTMDGLFAMIAEEEKKLRSNPVGAGSDLLKKVFGAL